MFVRGDSKIFRFQSNKAKSLFHQGKNPRKIAWTVLYRRQHRKGNTTQDVKTRKSRRTVKKQRAIEGATLEVIRERRSMPSSAREAARKQQIAQAKDKKQEKEAKKKADKAKGTVKNQGPAVSKQQMKGNTRR